MPVTVRLNHAIADGYLVANVFRLLEQEILEFGPEIHEQDFTEISGTIVRE